MLTVGSLFSGLGGLELGLERAGLGPVRFQVELDAYCRDVLAAHWPDAVRHSDIREVDFAAVERVDVLCGGFPCQPWSWAGKRRGVEDDRWLWPEFARAVRLVRPKYVVVENVPGVLAGAFGCILGDLAALGFDAEWGCLRASNVGATHRRERVFVLAYSDRSRQPQPEGRIEGKRERAGYRSETVADSCGLGSQADIIDRYEARGLASTAGHRPFPWPPEPEDRERWAVVSEDLHPVRKGLLNPAFCEWHMGFPDGWTTGPAGKRIFALGNAVVPQVAELVGRRVLELEAA